MWYILFMSRICMERIYYVFSCLHHFLWIVTVTATKDYSNSISRYIKTCLNDAIPGQGVRVLCVWVDDAGHSCVARPMAVWQPQGHYLVHLVQHLHQALQDCRSTQLLAMDYSKAFDRVNNNVAMCKLIGIGARGSCFPRSALSSPTADSGTMSEGRTVTCDASQGTELGPIVFLVMVNDVAPDHIIWRQRRHQANSR